jgi:hypothetical protein
MRRLLFIGLFIAVSWSVPAQNLSYARCLVDTLCSSGMHGRGYAMEGDKRAAEFIAEEMKSLGLQSFTGSYFQSFTIPINTFPGDLEVVLDSNRLIPGKDYIVYSSSCGASGVYSLVWENTIQQGDALSDPAGSVVVTDSSARSRGGKNPYGAAGYIHLTEQDPPSWHVSDGFRVNDHFSLLLRTDLISEKTNTISVRIENKYFEHYPTQNVIGFVEGTQYPDSFLVVSAHYDHLGRMGAETYFPGGHDNASGTAAMLDLASYFAKPENRLPWSVVFMAFGAEEAGLHGSFYYVKNPLFPLNSIKFLLNLDLVGSGSGGIKVVNGSVYKEMFQRLRMLNDSTDLLNGISPRGAAANSDHYPFYAAGVPGFFVYTLGDESKEYHTIYDDPENVHFTDYNDLFLLIVRFLSTFK